MASCDAEPVESNKGATFSASMQRVLQAFVQEPNKASLISETFRILAVIHVARHHHNKHVHTFANSNFPAHTG